MLRAPSVCYFAKYSTVCCQWIQSLPEATPYTVRNRICVWYFIALSFPKLACRRKHLKVKHKYCCATNKDAAYAWRAHAQETHNFHLIG